MVPHSAAAPPGREHSAGVFATRSPFRPNPIGLSCVKLAAVERVEGLGTVLRVTGADLMDGTPILDIKPYVPYADCHPDARGGFAAQGQDYLLTVDFPPELLVRVPEDKRQALKGVLAQDPRPAYQREPGPDIRLALCRAGGAFYRGGRTADRAERDPRRIPSSFRLGSDRADDAEKRKDML